MIDFGLYVIMDKNYFHNDKTLANLTNEVCKGGATVIQLREKDTTTKNFLKDALLVRKITKKFNIPFIVNDRVDIAIAANADGVHLGETDLPIDYAKKMLPDKVIIGSSANTVKKAVEAEKKGAKYVGVGCLFSSKTKLTTTVPINTISKIKTRINTPVVGIGGITLSNIEKVLSAGADGVCIANAILSRTDIKAQTRKFRIISQSLKMRNKKTYLAKGKI